MNLETLSGNKLVVIVVIDTRSDLEVFLISIEKNCANSEVLPCRKRGEEFRQKIEKQGGGSQMRELVKMFHAVLRPRTAREATGTFGI